MPTPLWIRTLSAKAVLAGGVVDIVATNLAMIPVLVPVFADPKWSGLSGSAQSTALFALFDERPSLYLTGLVLGCLCSILGGWVAARVAKHDEILNGAASALLCVACGVYGMVAYPGVVPLWQHAAFLVLSPALGASGGMIRARQVQRSSEAPLTPEPAAASPSGPLRGAALAVYVVNRLLLVWAFVWAAITVAAGAISVTERDTTALVGSIGLLALAVAGGFLCHVAARDLRRGSARHWGLHAGALAATVLPLALAAFAIVRANAMARAAAEQVFDSIPTFRMIAEDHPEFRESFVAFAGSLASQGVTGDDVHARAARWGTEHATPYLLTYIPRSSDSAARAFATALTDVLDTLRVENPKACGQWLYGVPDGVDPEPLRLSEAQQTALNGAIGVAVAAARASPAPLVDGATGQQLLEELFSRIRVTHGEEGIAYLAGLANRQHAQQDPVRACETVHMLYSAALSLPEHRVGPMIRFLTARTTQR